MLRLASIPMRQLETSDGESREKMANQGMRLLVSALMVQTSQRNCCSNISVITSGTIWFLELAPPLQMTLLILGWFSPAVVTVSGVQGDCGLRAIFHLLPSAWGRGSGLGATSLTFSDRGARAEPARSLSRSFSFLISRRFTMAGCA